jgi:hypothetical protein
MLLCFWGCSKQLSDSELPPGIAHLQNAKGGKGFQIFIEESLRESENFRRQLLSGQNKDFINTNLLAGAIGRFCDETRIYLKDRKGIDGFKLSESEVREAIQGKKLPSANIVYGGFTGKWYGRWDQMLVDHHWGKIVGFDRPVRIEIEDQKPVYLRSYQYCWVGDGYGLNVVASDDGISESRDFLLGYVTHVQNGDMNKPTKRRPHVGIYVGKDKLIWITGGEVFLEECYKTSEGVDAYAITGFFYTVTDGTLETKGCFQANYTRENNLRPDWFSFKLNLKIID